MNVVAPGGIETDFGGGALRDIPEVNAFIASQTALGHAGVPDDIGPVIAALLSPSQRWINARRIVTIKNRRIVRWRDYMHSLAAWQALTDK